MKVRAAILVAVFFLGACGAKTGHKMTRSLRRAETTWIEVRNKSELALLQAARKVVHKKIVHRKHAREEGRQHHHHHKAS